MTATLTKTLGSLDDFRGTLCVPGDPDYPRVRAIWNGQVAREPALIATCHDACDVRTVLRRAVDAGMVTAVRGRRAQRGRHRAVRRRRGDRPLGDAGRLAGSSDWAGTGAGWCHARRFGPRHGPVRPGGPPPG
ncbi:hypothetical protein TMLG_00710, partial [Mycobacterium tuberculosis SUMu012]